MRLRDQQVLVVAVIADQRKTFRAARQIVAMIAGDVSRLRYVDCLAYQEFWTWTLAVGVAGIARIELAAAVRAEPVNRIEIKRGGAEILDCIRVRFFLTERGEIERDVVVDELPQIGKTGRYLGVVARRTCRVGILHRIGKFLQRPVIDGERLERWKHPAEHAGIVMARQSIEKLPCRMAPCRAVAGLNLDLLRH